MRAVLPGKPQARLQAVATAYWHSNQIITYITGNAIVVLRSYDTVLQTIYDDDDTALEAIAIDERSGKIATCGGSYVRIYRPYGYDEGALQWSLQASITVNSSEDKISTLSWGNTEELLVGHSQLSLYSILASTEYIWSQKLANPAKFASLSYDSAYVASTGAYDPLVKVWRRLSFGSDDVRFDFTYLSHPQTVTELRWRRPHHLDQIIDNVLYTVCADNILRIWTCSDQYDLQFFQLCSQVDLLQCITPQATSLSLTPPRYVFIIDGSDFSRATDYAVQRANRSSQDHTIEHLKEIANLSPDICVVLDEHGYMSAWALENLGDKAQKAYHIFNIAHMFGLHFNLDRSSGGKIVRFYSSCNRAGGDLNIIVHHLEGQIEVFESNVAHLFDPLERGHRVVSKATWTGHSRPVQKIVRNVTGRAIVSRTDSGESVVWKHVDDKNDTVLSYQSVITSKEHVHRICVLANGEYITLLHGARISLWDCRPSEARLLAVDRYELIGKPLCILHLPEVETHESIVHVATISSQMKGIVWQLKLPRGVPDYPAHSEGFYISQLCTFDLGDADDLACVLPVDPAGSTTVISGFLDTFARDIVISYTNSGLLRCWTAKVDVGKNTVDWLLTCSVETSIIEPALASGSSIRKAALVNSTRSELTIWDTKAASLEFTQNYEAQDSIHDLDWTSTPDDQSILAVGFRHRVLLLSQMRYDYLNRGPAWAAIREINIRDVTPHPIGDSAWLGGGNLVIGAGNQLLVYDKTISFPPPSITHLRLARHGSAKWNLFDIVTRLNGPLPLFHPQFLSQCILAGKMLSVQRILLALYNSLKYYVDGDHVDSFLGMPLEDFYLKTEDFPSIAANERLTEFAASSNELIEPDTLTETVASSINEKLTAFPIAQLSGQEQIQLKDVVECVALVEKQRRSMDENATRFMLFFRQHTLRKGRAIENNLSWREINWAFHSSSQDILTEMVAQHFRGRMLWRDARDSGLFMWISDPAALRDRFEAIARNEYTKSDLKNPIDCSLFYLALRKKAVLSGLWRMAGWNREQGATLRLLSNNFQDPKWRTVALKNAYALLGKHRFEYAAAFFLLADSLGDAVNVCLNQLKDIQLAITVARIFEGEGGPVLKETLETKILPLAAQEGNRWLASWAFWMLHRRDMAVRALIVPVYTLLEFPPSRDQQSKLYLTDDPALVALYRQLRQQTLQTLRGASKISPKVEWTFVLHSARLYDRMGCDLLALDLVHNWEFLRAPLTNGTLGDVDPRKVLRRRSSLVVADLPLPRRRTSPMSNENRKPRKVFEEPEPSSLLDSFGL